MKSIENTNWTPKLETISLAFKDATFLSHVLLPPRDHKPLSQLKVVRKTALDKPAARVTTNPILQYGTSKPFYSGRSVKISIVGYVKVQRRIESVAQIDCMTRRLSEITGKTCQQVGV